MAVEPHSSGIKPSVFRTAAYSRLGQEQHYLGPLNGPELLVGYRKRKRWDRWRCRCWEAMLFGGCAVYQSRCQSLSTRAGKQLLHEIALMLPELLARWIEPYDRFTHRCRTLPTLSERGAQLSPITLLNYQRQLEAIIHLPAKTACKAGSNVM